MGLSCWISSQVDEAFLASKTCLIFSKNRWVFLLLGFINSFPPYLRGFCPRKSKPSSMWVIWVFSFDRLSPLGFRKDSMAGITSFSNISFPDAVTMKSSQYLMKLILWIDLRFPPCGTATLHSQTVGVH